MKNFIYYKEDAEYPKDKYFRPDKIYPEYPFAGLGISEEKNVVYEMIRDMFRLLELDTQCFGGCEWNPLGEYIKPGNVVLIKPNWVKHENAAIKGRRGIECLVTNTSILKCLIDYTLIALKGSGKVIVADAPMQSCDFEHMRKNIGLHDLEKFYKIAGMNVTFVDLRNYRSLRNKGNVVTIPTNAVYVGKVINLGKHSCFYHNCKEGRLRITNYDYRVVNRHHRGMTQEYCISEACLESDVIINLPKPKTHRKAGYTGALKNMIGVNAMKDYLPHHTKGSYMKREGDEYYSESKGAKRKSDINDFIDILEKKSLFRAGRIIRRCENLLAKNTNDAEKYSEGSWWGNDTIWKTILDINKIVLYADKQGQIRKDRQRRVITIGDMIVSGEGEGPIAPSPKKTNSIIFADNSVVFDEILVRFMGFEESKFRLLQEAKRNRKLFEGNIEECEIASNCERFCGKASELKGIYKFIPSEGWKGYIEKR